MAAVEAVWELLDSSVAGLRLQDSGEGGRRDRRATAGLAERQPHARWYDARCHHPSCLIPALAHVLARCYFWVDRGIQGHPQKGRDNHSGAK